MSAEATTEDSRHKMGNPQELVERIARLEKEVEHYKRQSSLGGFTQSSPLNAGSQSFVMDGKQTEDLMRAANRT